MLNDACLTAAARLGRYIRIVLISRTSAKETGFLRSFGLRM
jgi:hypothetical protein